MDDHHLEDIYHRFFYCLYGCNQKLRSSLDALLPYGSAYFYEFLTHIPLQFVGADEGKVNDAINEIFLLAPFTRRMIEESRIVPNAKTPDRLEFRSRGSEWHTPMYFAMRSSLMAKAMFRRWNGLKPEHSGSGNYLSIHTWSSMDSPLTKPIRPGPFCYGAVDRFVPAKLTTEYAAVQTEKASHHYLSVLQSLFNVAFPGKIGEDFSIPGIIVPIATRRLFYGSIWIIIPGLAEHVSSIANYYSSHPPVCNDTCNRTREELLDKSGRDDEVHIHQLLAELVSITHNNYVPVLALQHEQLCEELLGTQRQHLPQLKMKKAADFTPSYKCSFSGVVGNSPLGSVHMIEEGLFGLEKKRSEAPPNQKGELDVFKGYMVCSGAMIELLDSVVRAAQAVGGPGESLPAALIVGGPGAGKEKLARIFAAFTTNYSFGKRHTINMAALKPGAIAPFAIAGFDFSSGKNSRVSYSIDGILAALRDIRIVELEGKPLDMIKERSDFPMLVLDELNSMDHDSQGVLLRFLENAEVVPIGRSQDPLDEKQSDEFRKVYSNFLVVGMMNEDPDEISREQAMEFVIGSPYLRGLIADLLYEQVLKMRRLRPDIKYRMVRNGKLVIPSLSERREDLPILFYRFVNGNKRKTDPTPQILHLTLNAVSLLVRPDLKWPGNIRQLQALAAKVSDIVVNDERSKGDDNVCWVEDRHIEGGMIELGMLSRANPRPA